MAGKWKILKKIAGRRELNEDVHASADIITAALIAAGAFLIGIGIGFVMNIKR